MKLADIKKFKVAELRSRLADLGLDTRGLKAELVDRLWSASQAAQALEKATLLQNDSTQTLSKPNQTVSSSPSAVNRVAAPSDPDTATQTEPGPRAREPGPVTDFQAEDGGLGHVESPVSQDTGRGRAFYEFKEEIRYKRVKSPQPLQEWEGTEKHGEDKVQLDPHAHHLHFDLSPDGSCGQPRFWDQFPLLWSGCRLSHGVRQGSVGFEVRLERTLLSMEREDREVREPYGLRVGWSVADSSLLLGEDGLSFAYDGCSKKVSGGKEEDYGERLSEGDIVGCYASLSADGTVELFFHKNGRSMGGAFSLGSSVLSGRPLFPHILCRSCSVRLLLDPAAPQWYPGPMGFTPLAALPAAQRVCSTSTPTTRAQCEVVMMVGLPGSGKTFWAQNHMKQNPEKKFTLLGTEELLACMISGGQTEGRLQQASQCLTELIKIAAETPGNYILDQCNVLISARRHKLQLFAGFRRRVVVVFPLENEWKRRLSQHRLKDGGNIPETALLKLQVSCSLPEPQADLLEELQYIELSQERAQILLKEYQDNAHRLLPPVPRQEKKKPRFYKKRRLHRRLPLPQRIWWTGSYGWNDTRMKMQQPRYWSTPYQDHGY
ncbi:heterogeneous nuclear ribonucleoprotein U-like protein 2 [Nothobranchius furzeri]|uniref:Heterogeneous nuclear ribonucleoprotein U-like 2 n=1 Tax=Nothobranchius furzeri TaxID=105023 RepID=A0A1A8UNH7_NOTFU|nr:heterogeneous nuclear ribonucleoprotein U-like 2 [Nothobranchius furzeri]